MDQIYSFISEMPRYNYGGIPIGTLSACESELDGLGMSNLEGATEGAQELLTKAWEKLKEIARRIAAWFKDVPNKLRNLGTRIVTFLTRAPDVVELPSNAAGFDRKAADAIGNASHIYDEMMQIQEQANAAIRKVTSSNVSGATELFGRRKKDSSSQTASLPTGTFADLDSLTNDLLKKQQELMGQFQQCMQVSASLSLDSYLAMEADGGDGKTRRINIRGLKDAATRLLQKCGRDSDAGKRSAAGLEQTVNKAASDGDDNQKRSVLAKLARIVSNIGKFFAGIPSFVQSLMRKFFKGKAEKPAETAPA